MASTDLSVSTTTLCEGGTIGIDDLIVSARVFRSARGLYYIDQWQPLFGP